MDKYLDARFERVEKALAILIDSIAKFNPSEKLADDLATADRQLSKSLQELERHQNNHARIQQLRADTAALDAQTKDTISALWGMRKEVKNTATTTYPPTGPKYGFTTAELLNYARRISRNTLPPPGITNGVDMNTTSSFVASAASPFSGGGVKEELPSQDAQTPNANASFNNGNTPAPTTAPTPTANGQPANNASFASNATELPAHLKPYVNPTEGGIFLPWPTEDTIRSGALASYQQLVNNGINPKGYDPEEEEKRKAEEELARKEAEEQARLEREAQEKRVREERERLARERERARQEEARRGNTVGGVSGSPTTGGDMQKKKQFTFLGGDDDDDEDDE
ncbi:vitamin-D-receptor interacting mediator subunit 4-domain-containing protein [Apodospora peruviana]|uniref:Mediator of RNA polymerase II transcription subunit 4 n=1 Tax=Apodospora peruviana TaxID=516989 RepID=A0AAE0LZ91_9PEZI|nr:vitamin-D-receptor interacting mediator subunit 4-domain-containing protein [Apodospora peruviana]